MADQPDWMTYTPDATQLGGDAAAPQPGQVLASFISRVIEPGVVAVDFAALRGFAATVHRELDVNVTPNVDVILNQLMGPPGTPSARTFGADPRHEWAAIVGDYHTDCARRAQALLTDFQRGLYAIATAAEKILGDYRAADDSSAVDVTRVRGYLQPPSPNGGSPTEPSGATPAGGPAAGGSLADEIARRNAEAGA